MKKSLVIFIFLLILSIFASVLSMILVAKPSNINQCNNEGICTLMGYPPRFGFPISVNGGQFHPILAFAVNTGFYFIIFSAIYLVYLKLADKRKKK